MRFFWRYAGARVPQALAVRAHVAAGHARLPGRADQRQGGLDVKYSTSLAFSLPRCFAWVEDYSHVVNHLAFLF
jgi:hypothetical protein